MINTTDKTHLDDFIRSNLVNADENSIKFANAINIFLRDMNYQGFLVTQVYDEKGINLIKEGDHFQALKFIFRVNHSCVIFRNNFRDTVLVHFNFMNECNNVFGEYNILSTCNSRKYTQEQLIIQLSKKAKNIFLKVI
ncbi:hypothetical protein I6M70_17025 [Acinetobacter pittii]|uniref:hypothetical protein n=1 Tax=Acinetobacter pittii TaxID=48296 RepID=UPI0018FF801C|nr:hypothetical protein [Acinetobacter pittii]MBJ8481063.1 hypothetical protein [Acinetobacter pittii]